VVSANILGFALEAGVEVVSDLDGGSDNGPHFHGSLFTGTLLPWLKQVVGVTRFERNFREPPGEAKRGSDQHLASISGTSKRYLGGVLENIQAL